MIQIFLFFKKQNGWTLDKIHTWITADNKGIGGTVDISKNNWNMPRSCTSPQKK